MPSVALLSLLGAAALAGVRSAPVEKDDHVEEMVTRCIVEVLLNGLSKPNAPPINPLCKEFLKKSSQQKPEEKRLVQDRELNTRPSSESNELERPPERIMKEQLNEEEFKTQTKGGESWHPEEGTHEEKDDQQAASPVHKEQEKNEDEKGNGEHGSYTSNYHSKEGSREKKPNEEVEDESLDKKSLSTVGKVAEGDYKHSVGLKKSEESVHSQEKENQKSEEEEEEEEEEESSEKYHRNFHREYEDSYEKEAEVEKQDHKPRQNHQKPKLGNSSENRKYHNGEKRDSPEESSEEEDDFWDKRSRWPKHYYETGHRYEEKRNSEEIHGSEEMEGRGRSNEYYDRRYHSKEEEDTRHHGRGSEEKQHHYERKRLHVEPLKEARHYHEERNPQGKASEEYMGKQHSYGGQDEKQYLGREWQHLQMEEIPKSPSMDMEEGEQRFYSPKEEAREEKRHYPSVLEEELEKRHHSEGKKHGINKRTFLVEEGYPRSHYLVQNVKRAAASYIPYYQQLRWKNHHTEKKDDMANLFLESEEEPRSHLDERDFFPDYNDYEPWEKKQLMDSLNHKHKENSHHEKTHKSDVKRQYNRMDELAHLLSYRKKSVEFPELYSSNEDVKRGNMIRSDEGKLGQRPLTQEEELKSVIP
ncbi:secretogranin-1 isoform X2 [Heteronotia binoei]|uniref:secretogranin-1 isoform X2 n=1 Tax=Heteronotia binoei TaxID=13085 RepID=UPI002930E538|nr:secretogranin-1 isoform X2 [Heteronotia binoei]